MDNDKLEIQISSEEAEQKINKLETQYDALKRSIKEKLVVDFTVTDMATKIAAIKKNIPNLTVNVQTQTNKESIKTSNTILETSFKDIDVDVKPKIDPAASEKAEADLDDIGRSRTVNIRPVVKEPSTNRTKPSRSVSEEFKSSVPGKTTKDKSFQDSILSGLRSVYSEINQMTKWIQELYEGVLYIIRKTESMENEISKQTGFLRQIANKSFSGGDKNIYPELKRQTVLLKQISSKGIAVTSAEGSPQGDWTKNKTKLNPRSETPDNEQVIAETFLRYLNTPKNKRLKLDGIDERDVVRIFLNQDRSPKDITSGGVPVEDMALKTGIPQEKIKQIQNKDGVFGPIIDQYQLAYSAMEQLGIDSKSDNRVARMASAFIDDVNQWGVDALNEASNKILRDLDGSKKTPLQDFTKKNKAHDYKKQIESVLSGEIPNFANGKRDYDDSTIQSFINESTGIKRAKKIQHERDNRFEALSQMETDYTRLFSHVPKDLATTAREERQKELDLDPIRKTPVPGSKEYKTASRNLVELRKEVKAVGRQAVVSKTQVQQMLNATQRIRDMEPVGGKIIAGEQSGGKTYGTHFIEKIDTLEEQIKSIQGRDRVAENLDHNQEKIKKQWMDAQRPSGLDKAFENQVHNQEKIKKQWIDAQRSSGLDKVLESQVHNQEKLNKEWLNVQQRTGTDRVFENRSRNQKEIATFKDKDQAGFSLKNLFDRVLGNRQPEFLKTLLAPLKNEIGAISFNEPSSDRLGYEKPYSISEKYAERRKTRAIESGTDLSSQLREIPDYLKDTDRLGYETPSKSVSEKYTEKRFPKLKEHALTIGKTDYTKSANENLGKYKTLMTDIMDLNAKVALGEKQIADFKKEEYAAVDKKLNKMSEEKGFMFDLLEKEKLRKQYHEDINEAYKKKTEYIESDRASAQNLQAQADKSLSQLNQEVEKQKEYIKNAERIKKKYKEARPDAKTTKIDKRIEDSKDFIKNLQEEISLQKEQKNIIDESISKSKGLNRTRLQELKEQNSELKTAQDFIDKDKTTQYGSKESRLLGYGNIDSPFRGGSNWSSGGGGGGGGSDYIDQVPQNPLLGRFAQWGMMASGFAATVFLIQMFGAQLVNLMSIITSWEDGLLKIIDSTTLTGKDMDKLSDAIKSYAGAIDSLEMKSMTLEQATGAYGAAVQYGVAPTKQNIHQLNALEYSSSVADYKEAATIMAMAGTEIGNRMAESFSEQWEISSGKGKSSGSFGYEWNQMKSAGKGSLIDLFDKSQAQYGKQLTDLMAGITNWIQTNQPVIEAFVDSVANKVTVLFKAIQLALPGLIAFGLAFAAIHGSSLVIGFLTGISSQIMAIAKLGPVAATAIKGMSSAVGVLKWAIDGLKVTLLGVGPAILAMIAAWGVWKVGKHLHDIRKFKKELKEIRELNKLPNEKIANFSNDELNHYKAQSEDIISELKNRNKKIKEQQIAARKSAMVEEKTGYSIQVSGQSQKNKLILQKAENDRRIKEMEDAKKRVKEAENRKEANATGINLQDYEYSWEVWKEDLEAVNEELGIMPKELENILIAMEKVDAARKNITQGGGFVTYKAYSSKFDRLLQSSPETKSNWEVSLNRERLAVPGSNNFDEEILKEKQIRADIISDLNNLPPFEYDTVSHQKLIDALDVSNQKIEKLDWQSTTERVKSVDSAFKNLKETVEDLNKTDFEKTIANIFRTHGNTENVDLLVGKQRAILTKNLQNQLDKLRGEDLDLPKELRDINKNSLLPKEEKDILSTVKENLSEIEKIQIRINTEKEKGYKYSSDQQIEYEKEIKNLKAKNRHLLHPDKFTEKDLTRTIKYNDDNVAIDKEANRIKTDLNLSNWESTISGYTSEQNLSNLIEKKQNSIAKLFTSKEYDNIVSINGKSKEDIQEEINAYIDANEKLNAAKSNLSFQEGIDKKWSAGVFSDERLATHKNYIDSTINLLRKQKVDEETLLLIRKKMNIDLEKEIVAGKEKIWQDYYSKYQIMNKENYRTRKQEIEDQYELNVTEHGKPTADWIKQEKMNELNNKDRKGLYSNPEVENPLATDIGLIDDNIATKLMQDYQTIGQIIETSIGGAIDGVVDATTAWITGTESAKDAFKSMAYSVITGLTNMIAKQTIYNALLGQQYASGGSNAIGGVIGWAGEAISGMFATGGVLSGSSISGYSNSIVGSPTLLPDTNIRRYATGTAMIGEAGPEAVMPLTRLPSGNLGVEASSANNNNDNMGNISVEMNISNNGQPVSAKQDGQIKWDAASKKMVIGVILEAAEKNTGNFKSAMKMAVSS
jgi:hypothetical protein